MCLKKEGGYPSRLLTTKSTIKINYDCDSVAKLAIYFRISMLLHGKSVKTDGVGLVSFCVAYADGTLPRRG